MGKAGKWIKSLLNGGKKTKDKADKEKQNSRNNNPTTTDQIIENPTTPVAIPPTTPKDKKRWSFRRSSATAPGPKDSSSNESTPSKIGPPANVGSPKNEEKKPELIIAVGEAEAVTEDVSNESGDQDVIHSLPMDVQDAAAIKIQSVFRSYLARKALRALRGLVKLQALVRGHLVRRHTTTTLRCMQALITAQARARAQRIRSAEESKMYNNHRPPAYRIIGEDCNFRNSYHEVEKGMMEENIKIVEMDHGESEARSNYSYYQNNERRDDRFSTHYASEFDNVKQEYQKISPAPSAITDMSPRTCSAHFGDYTFTTAQSSPHCAAYPIQEYAESLSYDYPLYPNYMANTQSSRAKARSQSAPKQRPDSFERQLSKRRPSVEGRNIPRAVRMQRSSSNVGATPHNYHYPWSIKLDKSTVSLLESECGSTCSVLTTTNYSRFDVPNDHAQGHRY